MGQGTLTIFSASAGSGKTFRLAGSYLSMLFRSGNSYRKILAVTFTNKATAEMKGRILDQLFNLAEGGNSEYLPELMRDTGKTEKSIRKEAGEILFSILHDFSRFSVSTIDAFFQKILRSFVKEAGLHSGFNIELDHSVILSAAIDDLLASSADDAGVRNWLSQFVIANLDDEKSWNLKQEILGLAQELFREKYKILSEQDRNNLENKEYLLRVIAKIRAVAFSFEQKMKAFGKESMDIFTLYDLTDEMFYQKSRGIPGFIRSLDAGKIVRPGDKIREIENDPPRWATKDPSPNLLAAVEGGLDKLIRAAIRTYDSEIAGYNTAKAILSNIYTLGILSDISRKVHKITTEENTFLLSDAGELLRLITREDQIPFIYEKTGSSFENFMIDEFQDTSLLQWANFEPLISESMSNGHDNLVVGDIKQSIYRFRNSDWRILSGLHDLVDNKRYLSRPLKTNWRSRENIIMFNNSVFSLIPELLGKSFTDGTVTSDFKNIYSGAVQADPGIRKGGYVRIRFIDDVCGGENDQGKGKRKKIIRKWEDAVLDELPSVIESLQDKGYRASDIGIIVREAKEGEAVLRKMVGYGALCGTEKNLVYNYNIVSGDSLSLSGSHAISFIISALRVMSMPGDLISRAAMTRYFLLATSTKDVEDALITAESVSNGSPGILPPESNKFLLKLREMPLFEVVENLIGFYGLGNLPENVAYLSTFQDLVLNFEGGTNADISAFLEWWESTGCRKSVTLSANQDAIRVLTIHKAKGLEFRVVILPFISWNLDHKNIHQPVLWVKPQAPPFNELKILPVRYCSDLADTLFADEYRNEKLSVYIDNINLLYVAMTRAMDALYGFAPLSPASGEAIAGILKDAVSSDINPAGNSGFVLGKMYNEEAGVFEFGEIPVTGSRSVDSRDLLLEEYRISNRPGSLRLKLHGEAYFSAQKEEITGRINYGNLMHEVFETIDSYEDISRAVKKMVLEGRIPESESLTLEEKLKSLVSEPPVSEWFRKGAKTMRETEILLASGLTRRPDRVIIMGNKAVVVDFKFGETTHDHASQVRNYMKIMKEMGYTETDGYLWYVDKNEIVRV